MYVDPDTAKELFDGARPFPAPGGRSLLVARPEHLAAMKALAIKNDPTRLYQDLADVRFLLGIPSSIATRSAGSSSGTASRRDSMKSQELSEKPAGLEWRIPTTNADVRALRLQREAPRPIPLTSLNRLSPRLFPAAPRRRTLAGAEPFRL